MSLTQTLRLAGWNFPNAFNSTKGSHPFASLLPVRPTSACGTVAPRQLTFGKGVFQFYLDSLVPRIRPSKRSAAGESSRRNKAPILLLNTRTNQVLDCAITPLRNTCFRPQNDAPLFLLEVRTHLPLSCPTPTRYLRYCSSS